MAAGSKERRNPATCLTDDLIVEILSRLPVKSVCRFMCVSKHWLGLISHPDHRKKLPQTLAGIFYHTTSSELFPELVRHFTNVTGKGAPLISPSLSFLLGHADITLLDCYNGLLLCRSRTTAGANRYVVCNPTTEEWVALPESSEAGNICDARLGFDPVVCPNFHVFDLWHGMSNVFLNRFLHVLAYGHGNVDVVLVVDTEGNSWRTIPVPQGYDDEHDLKLSLYVLEDYASDEWIFKHSVMISNLFKMSRFALVKLNNLITIHPECHLIFFVSDFDHTIRCYDMDSRNVCVICSMECEVYYNSRRCLSYVPLFSEHCLPGTSNQSAGSHLAY
ncbi:hypothetical protein BDA96_01G349800 [Sorghum bicolor]|uniref:F-box domain-containing protein n=1 Tax=Sorghum bicolor TaxID=4558 RepID=A0A921UZT8_SORBI|nr:hypothetical protein BDA96_01G349800 [Sorghum bicolor]